MRFWETDFLSSAGAGKNCALSMRLSRPSPVLDKNSAPLGPKGAEMLSSTEAGVWRKAPKAFPDSSSVLDRFQSARFECGSDAVRMWFGCGSDAGSDAVRMWFGRGSDVFSDLV